MSETSVQAFAAEAEKAGAVSDLVQQLSTQPTAADAQQFLKTHISKKKAQKTYSTAKLENLTTLSTKTFSAKKQKSIITAGKANREDRLKELERAILKFKKERLSSSKPSSKT